MTRIAWGAKVSDTFLDRAAWIVDDLLIGDNTDDGLNKLMSCMAWESGRSFNASVTNMAGSGAVGLIQFMPSTAQALGTTTAKLMAMTPEDQLNYVWKYFSSYKGKLKTLGDLYMAILWPAGVGQSETFVLWDSKTRPTTYRQNSGLDINKDGVITKAEATAKVTAMMTEGLSAINSREYSAKSTPREEMPEPLATPQVIHDIIPAVLSPVINEDREAVIEVASNMPAVIEKAPVSDVIKKAASGWQGNFAGAALVLGSLLLDPNFSALLGRFTTALATGNGRWGAFAALAGAALVAYRSKGHSNP